MADKEIDCWLTDQAVCPYCGYADQDSWELGDGGEGSFETDCGECGLEYIVERHVSVSYSSKPKVQKAK